MSNHQQEADRQQTQSSRQMQGLSVMLLQERSDVHDVTEPIIQHMIALHFATCVSVACVAVTVVPNRQTVKVSWMFSCSDL